MARKWLEKAIETDYLPVLRSLEDTPEGRQQAAALNQIIRQDWEQHGAMALPQKQGLSDELRRYIKDKLGETHWVLDYLGLTTEEYAEINDRKQGRVAARNEATQQLENPEKIVAKAVELIRRRDWADIAAGLAVLTGRRVAEVLSTAHFEKKSQWSVTFRGALKRRGEVGLEFEIPTLTTADRVIDALSRLRAELPEAIALDPKVINRKYEQAVARACDCAFADLVPTRDGKDTLYTHLFRAVYATIATFWYCPPSVNEIEFRAAIQGHYAIQNARSSELQRSLAASRHYLDYEIADREIANYHGKRKGIKLGVGGIQPIEAFREAWEKGSAPKVLGERKVCSSFRVWHDDKLRLNAMLELFKSAGTQQQERFHAFLNWLEQHQERLGLFQFESTEAIAVNIPSDVEDIHMQSRPRVLEHADVDAMATPSAVPTDSKIDRLIDTMERFMELQIQMAQSQMAQSMPVIQSVQAVKAHQSLSIPLDTLDQPEALTDNPSRLPHGRTTTRTIAHRLDQAIDAIMAYNDAPGRKHDDKWAIGINTLKAFVKSQEAIVKTIGGKNRKGQWIIGTRQAEIEHHHAIHQIDPLSHNYKHRGKRSISQIIPLALID